MKIRAKLLRALFAIMILAPVGLSAGCATDRAVVSQASRFHSGSGIEKAILNDRELNNYLQAIGDRIIQVAREMDGQHFGPESHRKERSDWMFSPDMKFHFVNSKSVNAFTTGGNHMYIYTELFRKCRTEDELAAVMAHEYAHVYARHVHKGMNRQMAVMGGAAAAGAAGYYLGGEERGKEYAAYGFGGGMLLGQVFSMGFTREDEAEADALGFEFYVRAGYDPHKFGDFFQQMIDMGYDKSPEILSDHPSLKNRVADARKRAGSLPGHAVEWRRPPVAEADRFAKLQARSAQIGRNMPTDQTLTQAQELLAAMPRSCLTPIEPPDQQRARQQLVQQARAAEEKKPNAPAR